MMIAGARVRRGWLRSLQAREPLWRTVVVVATVWGAYAAVRITQNVHSLLLMWRGEYSATDWQPSVQTPRSYGIPVVSEANAQSRISLQARRSLVLVYSIQCEACGHNMARWVDLISAVDSSVEVYAASRDPLAQQRAYWSGVDARVTLLQLSPDIQDVLRSVPDRVPATLVVRDGLVVLQLVGTLDKHRMQRVREVLQND